MKKQISEMTSEECLDELTFRHFKNLLLKARKKSIESIAASALVYQALDDMCIDADNIPSNAENADSLLDAISCFIDYGEYSVAGIMREIKAAYGMGEKEETE